MTWTKSTNLIVLSSRGAAALPANTIFLRPAEAKPVSNFDPYLMHCLTRYSYLFDIIFLTSSQVIEASPVSIK